MVTPSAGFSPAFEGFSKPQYTPVPDAIFDELMPTLSYAEILVLLYIIRRTFGFKKKADAISIDQMENGVRKKDGTVLDRGTGLSRRSILPAVRSLVKRGIVLREERVDPRLGSRPSVYSLRFKPKEAAGEGEAFSLPPGEESSPPPGKEISPHKKQDPRDSSDNTSPTPSRRLSEEFYTALGRKVSEQKIRKGEEEVKKLLEGGFSEAEVESAISHVASKYPDTQTIGRLPFLIDEALQVKVRDEARKTCEGRETEEAVKRGAEELRRQEEAERAYRSFHSLSEAERRALLDRAPRWLSLERSKIAWAASQLLPAEARRCDEDTRVQVASGLRGGNQSRRDDFAQQGKNP